MKELVRIIDSIDNGLPNINPTIIYNEGWMIRLLVQQSIIEKTVISGIDFSQISHWTSEALISSPFIKAPNYREGYTHADIALGDFSVDYSKRGEIRILDDARVFGIIEAKMGSNLSKGTTHVKNYSQASRNLACIAHNAFNKTCKTFFAVVAPEAKLDKHQIERQIELENLIQQIKDRFSLYPKEFRDRQNMDMIISKAESSTVNCFSFETWIECIKDQKSKDFLRGFYEKALSWNRIGRFK